MAGLPAASVDAVVCDPPYGLSFMGKDWDHGVPGVAFWSAALRVAKPGAHLLAFGGTRTFHRLAVAIEDAGWEIRDTVMWVYGSGFPKSHNVGKGIDKAAGAERDVVGVGRAGKNALGQDSGWNKTYDPDKFDITVPATPDAEQWDGWGTALKPAWEPIIVARKPLEGTVAANVLAHGTGALNIDGCRVSYGGEKVQTFWNNRGGATINAAEGVGTSPRTGEDAYDASKGRWPANLIHDGSDEVLAVFPQTTSGALNAGHKQGAGSFGKIGGDTIMRDYGNDTGSAARFFYCAKASRADRNDGLLNPGARRKRNDTTGGKYGEAPNPKTSNHHPTVKPTALMRYLCKLVTPPAGTVLDPFMGSGSTGKAAVLEGFGFIGIEQDAEYIAIARARIAHAVQSPAQQPLHI